MLDTFIEQILRYAEALPGQILGPRELAKRLKVHQFAGFWGCRRSPIGIMRGIVWWWADLRGLPLSAGQVHRIAAGYLRRLASFLMEEAERPALELIQAS